VDSELLSSLLYTWGPILLMIGFWMFFMKRMGTFRHKGYVDRQIEFMARQEQLLERIATALERRNG
jgi:hypothetical protein